MEAIDQQRALGGSDESVVSRARFGHKSLEHPTSIRVVELSPAEEYNDEIICQLRVVDLDQSPEYEAISYVWGSENDKADILCDGKLLQIPQNLATALRILRPECSASWRVLWADSICIDQNNIREKSHQVGIMKRVFESASRVLIWLGWEKSEHVLETLEGMALFIEMDERPGKISDPMPKYPYISSKGNEHKLVGEAGHLNLLKAYFRLLHNPWFHRAWTFQEYILAKDCRFFYGRHSFPARDLKRSTSGGQIEIMTFYPDIFSKVVETMLLSRDTRSGDYSLRTLLKRRRGCACTRAVDIVYSLLGVATDASDIVPDYEKDFLQVFSEATLHIIGQSNDLNVLGDGNSVPRSTSSELPSWLPDWHHSGNCIGVLYDHSEQFSCAGDTVARYIVSSDFRELTLRGFEIDSVEYLSPAVELRDLMQLLLLYKSLIKDLGILLRAIFEKFDSKPSDTERTDRNLYDLITTQHVDDVNIVEALTKLWMKQDFKRHHPFMVTRAGRLGIAPHNTELGDVVTVCLGGRVPLLLRPTETKHQFLFVGQCYVDQMMEGQAMELHADQPMVNFVLV